MPKKIKKRQPPSPKSQASSRRPERAKIIPLNDKVLIKKDDKDEFTAGGVLMPEFIIGFEEMFHTGTVIAVGPGRLDVKKGKRIKISAEPGQHVAYRNTMVDRLEQWGEDHKDLVLVFDRDVLGVIN